ncbi:MAG: hypothetical protein ACR2OD_03860, partial [Gaiellaceae bacterium]
MDKSKDTARPRGLRWVVALLAVVLASVMIPAAASAGGGSFPSAGGGDPQRVNAPLLNWNGGLTQLQKCFAFGTDIATLEAWAVDEGFGVLAGLKLNSTFVLENWTGTGLGPIATNQNRSIVVTGGFVPVVRGGGISVHLCFSSDWTSQKPGLAVIKGTFSGPALEFVLAAQDEFPWGISLQLGLHENEPQDQHQWLAGWMTLTNPELVNEPADSPNPDAITKNKFPKGEIPHMAKKSGYDLRVRVNGLLPLGNKKGKLPEVLTLPGDYALLAGGTAEGGGWAIDGRDPWCVVPGSCPLAWDVHDDKALSKSILDPVGHAGDHVPGVCNGYAATGATIDAVDNCLGGESFSTVFGDVSTPFGVFFGAPFELAGFSTVGPFDETRPWETLLSDGKLDYGDAMMPAAKLIAWIHPASKDKPLGGAGKLTSIEKEDVYSIDLNGDGDTEDAHELYAPFYEQYIPATSRGPISSGTDGVANANNFYGFKNVYGVYENWDFVDKVYHPGGYSECIRDWGHENGPDDKAVRLENNDNMAYLPNLRPLPRGVNKTTLWTDEHGEAFFHWKPGYGFNFLAIPGVFIDDNKACD